MSQTLRRYQEQPTEYRKGNEISSGTYGTVYKSESGRFAIKTFTVKCFDEDGEEYISDVYTYREIATVKKLSHPNIIEFVSVFCDYSGRMNAVFPFIRHTLATYPHVKRDMQKLCKQLVSAVKYCHDVGVTHRDIKNNNILVTDDGALKLIDFGLARLMSCTLPEERTEKVYTLWFRPLEVLLDNRYGYKADVWALGCVIASMVSGGPLFPGDSETDQVLRIIKEYDSVEEWPEIVNTKGYKEYNLSRFQKKWGKKLDCLWEECKKYPGIEELLRGTLRINPSSRFSIYQVFETKYVGGRSEPFPSVDDKLSFWSIKPEAITNISDIYYRMLALLKLLDVVAAHKAYKDHRIFFGTANLIDRTIKILGTQSILETGIKSEAEVVYNYVIACFWIVNDILGAKHCATVAEIKDIYPIQIAILKEIGFDMLCTNSYDFVRLHYSHIFALKQGPNAHFQESVRRLYQIQFSILPFHHTSRELSKMATDHITSLGICGTPLKVTEFLDECFPIETVKMSDQTPEITTPFGRVTPST